ncbi:MAG: NAD(P)H-hydrate dehydratase [candidate division WOR-3 bacterium]|nr:NAD(P)H-hydrate dehydratase [candidate division WOR-3 bacterium]MCX7837522.1 NAD(P)H-hydrate dehydratase [candidate division WOR-3 bacterium]MDW8113834.1 NAD(P)H-hydrate dehydratase [candidate division WOR-3 bacterium]
MKRIVSQKEMSEIDKISAEKLNIPTIILMENAGRSVAEYLKEIFGIREKDFSNKNFLIFCGKGNNGGDGFVSARFLLNKKAKVKVILLGKFEELKGDAKINAERYKNMGGEIIEIIKEEDFSSANIFFRNKRETYIIDAIFGTGVKGEIEGIYKKAIEFINQSGLKVIAIDVPSGVMEDGKVANICVKADFTITMGFIKRSLLLPPARDYVGKILIGDIGTFYEYFNNQGNTFLIEEEDVRDFFPKRLSWGHKGTFGSCLIIAGSRGYSGAAFLASVGALKIGSGLVYLATPKIIIDVIETKLTEVVKIPLNWEEGFTLDNLDKINELWPKIDVLAIGPGIGTNEKTKLFVKKILTAAEERKIPVVIDADGINCLSEEIDLLKGLAKNIPIILTPHPGELSRLIKILPEKINESRIEIARSFSQEKGVYLVLKGSPTVIGTPQGMVYINPTGNSGLASGGSGDVLTGFIAGLLAQKLAPEKAAIVGVYLHGLSADLALENQTEYDFIASDIFVHLPKAIKKILNA